jgi:Protein of unknown function (DUF1236)
MKLGSAIPTALSAVGLLSGSLVQPVCAQTTAPDSQSAVEQPQLALTPAQRRIIYDAVRKDKAKQAKPQFPAAVGASVPPMIELHALPDTVLAENRTANFFEYALVQDKVVLVDPTRMRVVDVIGPQEGH